MQFCRTLCNSSFFLGLMILACGRPSGPAQTPAAVDGLIRPQSWSALPAIENLGTLLALATDAGGHPLVAMRRNNGRHYSGTGMSGVRDVPATSVNVLRFDGREWNQLGGALEGEADEVEGWHARLLVDGNGAPIVIWHEWDGAFGEVRTVHARRWNGASWEPLSATPLTLRSDNAVLLDARMDGSQVVVLLERSSGFELKSWDGVRWQMQPVAVTSRFFDDAMQLASFAFASAGMPVFGTGDMLLTSPIASAPDGGLFRVSNDRSGASATLETWKDGWTAVTSITGAAVLPPAGGLLSPAIAIDREGTAVVSWLAADSNVYSQVPHTTVVGRWETGGFSLLGTFPTTGYLTVADRALLAIDGQDNLYVAVIEDGFDQRIVIQRYGR